jgi:thiol-disulfide isomerase/thioredoxin
VLPRDLAGPPGGLALLQLSSQFCADCRASRAVLTDVAGEHPGLTVREVDVAVRPELVRLLGIRRTPTTLVVDSAGVELARTVGVPRRADLLGTLDPWRRTG